MDWEFAQQMLFWAFVPSMATKFIQKQYYSYRLRRVPAADAQRKHYRVIYTVVVLAYLLYSFIQVERGLPRTHYDVLGLPRGADATDMRKTVRQMTLMFHPDKLQSLAEPDRVRAEEVYLHMRQAWDVLKEPASREIYDKYGPTPNCQRCITDRDFLYHTLPSVAAFYGMSAGLLALLSLTGTMTFGRYWRFTGLLLLGTIELGILTRPAPGTASLTALSLSSLSSLLSFGRLVLILPHRTAHEHIILYRQLLIVASVAVSQLGPVLFADSPSANKDGAVMKQLLNELESLTNLQLRDSAHAFRGVFEPFQRDAVAVAELRRKMEKMAVDMRLLEGDQELVIAKGRAQMRASKRR
ncbi:hypothetical protein HDU88_005112 [Geranomyces variabilis]|nr:hypothetical protein HDU88_005112 [Geranomyces variabilis]